ncbi:MAG: manganese catalase family protein [Clostridiaceae bacterium]|nr:manganese catalase family protein [Clostridiaceae bacterium]
MYIFLQYGGPDGELGASLRYLSQRFAMPFDELKGLLTDIGTEELGHLEMIGAIVYQLTRNLSEDEIKRAGFDAYFVDHTTGVYPSSAAGVPFTASYIQSKGDIITDLTEDLAAEQKARTTYDNILRLVDDPDVREPIKFLRAREIVHFQRFGEGLRLATDRLNEKNFYAFNPSFDKNCL